MRSTRERTRLAIVAAMLAGCGGGGGGSIDAPPGGGDGPGPGPDAAIAAPVGQCVPFEPVPGYQTCLLDAPQTRNPGMFSPLVLPPGPPPPVDHRADYLDGCLQVHSQGQSSWCAAHAATALLEARHCEAGQQTKISPPHLWWHSHGKTDFPDLASGMYIEDALGTAADPATFLVDSYVWPFTPDAAAMNSSRPTPAKLTQLERHGGTDYIAPVASLTAIRAALAAGHDVEVAVRVLDQAGWERTATIVDGVIDAPPGEGTCNCAEASCTATHCQRGSHAILVTGYLPDVNGDLWYQFVNSWGTGWGDGGWGLLSERYLVNYADAGALLATTRDKPLMLRSIQTEYYRACAVGTDDLVWCWGSNTFGEAGHTSLGNCMPQNWPCTTTPMAIPDHAFASVQTGNGFTCGLDAAGAASCWGSNLTGKLGAGLALDYQGPAPVAVSGGIAFSSLDAGAYHTCGIAQADGRLYCWGGNSYGQFGTGSTTDSAVPVEAAPALFATNGPFRAVAAGSGWTCVIDNARAAWCFGLATNGQLGIPAPGAPYCGSWACSRTPVAVQGGLTFASLAAGGYHTCGLVDGTGQAYCWGSNSNGQLGSVGPSTSAPVAVAGGTGFASISTTNQHTCAVTAAGQAWCWGLAMWGSLGDGATGQSWMEGNPANNSATPVAVAGGPFREVHAGEQTTCAVTTAGVGQCWGIDSIGGLGAPGRDTCAYVSSGGVTTDVGCSLSPSPIE